MMAAMHEIETLINKMNPAQKAGQLFLLAYPGKDPSLIKPIIDQYGICGCYISQDNAETFAEAEYSAGKLQAMSMAAQNLPLLLGVDQEGAWGVLVPESHTGPGNLALGAAMDDDVVFQMYQAFGREMLSVGYNALLGPCSDVNSNPNSPIIGTRSFGEFPERVAGCVKAAVAGARTTGVLTTVKHFPGHGATEGDTHRFIPEVNKPMDEIMNSDLLPFRAGIEAGVKIVMTSHIKYPKIDPDHPATLSKKILLNLLRGTLGFSGLILSDSMNMGAIRKFYDPAESTLLALKAGVDVVMLSEEHYDHSENYLGKQLDSIEVVRKAIETGNLSETEVNAKLRRILDLKLNHMKIKEPAPSSKDRAGIINIENRAAHAGFTLIQKGLWPLPEGGSIVCVNATPRDSYKNITNIRGIGPNQAKPAFDSFKEAYGGMGKNVIFVEYDEMINSARLLREAEAIIVVTEDYPLPGEDFDKGKQQELVKKLCAEFGAKLIILGLRSSYELLYYPETVTYLCAYSSRTCSARAAAEILAKEIPVSGTAPVSVRF